MRMKWKAGPPPPVKAGPFPEKTDETSQTVRRQLAQSELPSWEKFCVDGTPQKGPSGIHESAFTA